MKTAFKPETLESVDTSFLERFSLGFGVGESDF